MGEIIKTFQKLPNGMEIELNKLQIEGQDYVIHIQNGSGRLALSKSEFIQLAILFYNASDKLKGYKK